MTFSERSRNLMLRSLWKMCALATREQRLVVLTFHRVMEKPDALRPDEVQVSEFRSAMQLLRECFPVVPLGDALDKLAGGQLGAAGVAITFDDGYMDNYEVALPILQEFALPATFFVATGFLDGGRMWNDTVIESVRRLPGELITLPDISDAPMPIATEQQKLALIVRVLTEVKHWTRIRRQAYVDELATLAVGPLPDNLMMRSRDVRSLAMAGMEIGGHTIDHPILSQESEEEALRQVTDSRTTLAEISGQDINVFAYPNGRPNQDFGKRETQLVKQAGFRTALTTSWGSIGVDSDPFQLPRIALWDWRPGNIGLRISQCLFQRGEKAAA